MNGTANLDALLRRVNCYRNIQRVKGDVNACIAQVRTLSPKIESLIHNNGLESELLVLGGTVAIMYRGSQYNIPVEIYVSEPYPEAPPRCYVRPTREMDIKAGHRHVDREGLVYLPYLHEWNPRSHNLIELCAAMSSIFGMDPPVYAVKKPAGGGGGVLPIQGQPITNTYPGSVRYQTPTPGGGGQQYQQPPPPAYETVTANQAEMKRKEALQQVLSKTQRSLQEFYGKVQTELKEEQSREAALQVNRRDITASITHFKKLKESLEGRIKEMTEKDTALDKWVAEQSTQPEVHVDDMVEAVDVPSKQMLELVAQNAALEDALYHLDKALQENQVDLVTFLKKVREMSREQFMCVALVNKIYRAQSAHLVASRAAMVGGGAPQQQLQQQQQGTFAGPVSYPVLPSGASR